MTKHILIALIILLSTITAKSQYVTDTAVFSPEQSGTYPKKITSALDNISVSGYYRFLGYYNDMNLQYPEMGSIKRRVFIGDDSNIPQLLMNIAGKPSKTTSFSTDVYLWTPLSGSTTDNVNGLNLGVNLYGSHSTSMGTFQVKTGGIHWYALSPLTFAANTGYNRFSLFERNPWDPSTADLMSRYTNYYKNGALTQDIRWGQQAFQGFIFEGSGLPQGFSLAFMHGKSQFNGGTLPRPNLISGGKIRKDWKRGFVSINAISSKTYTDSLTDIAIGYNLITTQFEYKGKLLEISGELGSGNYYSPTRVGKWGEALDVKVRPTSTLLAIPLEFRFVRISPDVINNNGVFWNSSIQEYNSTFSANQTPGSQTPLIPFASSLVSIGQLTNNRTCGIINLDLPLGKHHKLAIGYSVAQEIKALSKQITYGHPANNLALSRFWRWNFPSGVGPYANLNKIYRGVYETLGITDSVTAKGFNSIEVCYKNSLSIRGKRFMFLYLGGFHTVQRSFSVVPQFNRSNYLQSLNQQVECYLELHPKVVVSNYFGYDHIVAGRATSTNSLNQKQKDQTGTSYAIGLDIQLAKQAGLYLRQRWINYSDKNFALDQYKGMETTVDLKLFF